MRFSSPTLRSLCLSLAGSALVLSGCAGDKPPTLGERIASIGDTHSQLADEWHAAHKLKNDAEDDIRKLRKEIDKTQKRLDRAQRELSEATKRANEGRQRLAEVRAEAARRGIAVSPGPE